MKSEPIPIHVVFTLLLGIGLGSLVLLPVFIICLIIFCFLFMLSWPVYRIRGRSIKFLDFPTLFKRKAQQEATLPK